MTRALALGFAAVVALTDQYSAPVAAPNPASAPAAPKSHHVDALFVRAATGSNAQELTLARLALARGGADEVRGFAEKMIVEHQTLGREAATLFGRPNVAPSPADLLALSYLRAVPSVDFDQQYITGQIGDHLGAIAAFNAEARDGANPRLRAFAAKWLPTMQAHLQLAVDIAGHVGGSSPFKPH